MFDNNTHSPINCVTVLAIFTVLDFKKFSFIYANTINELCILYSARAQHRKSDVLNNWMTII